MKRIKIGLVIVIGCFFLLGLSGSVYASLILDEPFENLDNWTVADDGAGVSEISSGDYLHQEIDGAGWAYIHRNIGTIGTGDYTVEFMVKIDVNANDQNKYIRIDAGTNRIDAHFDANSFNVSSSTGFYDLISGSFLDKYYMIHLIVHDNQTLVDAYLDGILQSSNVACDYGTGTDGNVQFMLTQTNKWHVDYLKIYEGKEYPADPNPGHVPEPGTMMLLGSLATGLFGITRIRKKRKRGSMKKALMILVAMIFVFGMARAVNANPNDDDPLKWSQLPDMVNGFDVASWEYPDGGFSVVADDWLCTNGLPITEIDWWGSYWTISTNIGWRETTLPENAIQGFAIVISDDVPADDPDNEYDYSHPGDYWFFEEYFDLADIEVDYAGEQQYTGHSAFRYSLDLEEPFLQEEGEIYWLQILGYTEVENPQYAWGWKTAHPDYNWNDDATRLDDYTWDWTELRYPEGHPYEGQSINMSFELTTIPEPGTMILLGSLATGLFGIAGIRRKNSS